MRVVELIKTENQPRYTLTLGGLLIAGGVVILAVGDSSYGWLLTAMGTGTAAAGAHTLWHRESREPDSGS